MIGAVDIARLLPHAGSMVLLDCVAAWDGDSILCRASSHLDQGNPLRRRGQLSAVCGIEYALQAAALHGALRGGTPQPPGYLAALRMTGLTPRRLDDPALGALRVGAALHHASSAGLLYGISLRADDGTLLLAGRATIVLPA